MVHAIRKGGLNDSTFAVIDFVFAQVGGESHCERTKWASHCEPAIVSTSLIIVKIKSVQRAERHSKLAICYARFSETLVKNIRFFDSLQSGRDNAFRCESVWTNK